MATSAKTYDKKSTQMPTALFTGAAIVALIGIAAWIYQLNQGMQVTGLGQQVVWGIYIAAFFTAVGAGAALLGLAGLSEFLPFLPGTARRCCLAAALAAFVSGGLLISMDVGNPLQLWRIVTAFRFNSMMTWDFWLLAFAVAVTVVYLLTTKSSKPARLWGGVAMVVAVLVVVVEGWMLSTQAARTMWGTSQTLVSFLVGAALAGLGLAALILPKEGFVRQALTGALGLSLLLVAADILTGLVARDPRTRAEISLLLGGSPAPFFWFQLVAGLVLPLGLVFRGRNLPLAGGLAVLGVLADKVWLLTAGQAEPWLALPVGAYSGSWVELAATVGAVGLGMVVFQVSWKWISAR